MDGCRRKAKLSNFSGNTQIPLELGFFFSLSLSLLIGNIYWLLFTGVITTLQEIDETPPVHKRLDFIMPCIGRLQEAPACSRYTWRMRFSAKDTHSAVTVRVNANPSGLSCSPRGTDGDREVICHYQ